MQPITTSKGDPQSHPGISDLKAPRRPCTVLVVYEVRAAVDDDARAAGEVFTAAGLCAGDYSQTTYRGLKTTRLYVAAEADTLVGAIWGRFDGGGAPGETALSDAVPPNGWIDLLGVRPSARGRGIGRQLVQSFTRDAAEAGCGHVFLLVDRAEGVAERIEFFRRCGFCLLEHPDTPAACMGAPVREILAATAGDIAHGPR